MVFIVLREETIFKPIKCANSSRLKIRFQVPQSVIQTLILRQQRKTAFADCLFEIFRSPKITYKFLEADACFARYCSGNDNLLPAYVISQILNAELSVPAETALKTERVVEALFSVADVGVEGAGVVGGGQGVVQSATYFHLNSLIHIDGKVNFLDRGL